MQSSCSTVKPSQPDSKIPTNKIHLMFLLFSSLSSSTHGDVQPVFSKPELGKIILWITSQARVVLLQVSRWGDRSQSKRSSRRWKFCFSLWNSICTQCHLLPGLIGLVQICLCLCYFWKKARRARERQGRKLIGACIWTHHAIGGEAEGRWLVSWLISLCCESPSNSNTGMEGRTFSVCCIYKPQQKDKAWGKKHLTTCHEFCG